MDFKKAKTRKADPNRAPKPPVKAQTTAVTESRCSVCTHPQRKFIDRALAKGIGYSELGRVLSLDRRALSHHDKNHLSFEDAALRRIIAQEAAQQAEDYEEGVQGVLRRRVYLETALHKALEALGNGEILVEPKDAIAIIDKLDRQDAKTSDAQILQMRLELNAVLQAIKETVPKESWEQIARRSREIVKVSSNSAIAIEGSAEEEEA